jgi:hypothetical protein
VTFAVLGFSHPTDEEIYWDRLKPAPGWPGPGRCTCWSAPLPQSGHTWRVIAPAPFARTGRLTRFPNRSQVAGSHAVWARVELRLVLAVGARSAGCGEFTVVGLPSPEPIVCCRLSLSRSFVLCVMNVKEGRSRNLSGAVLCERWEMFGLPASVYGDWRQTALCCVG